MFGLRVPILSLVIGEGGSGGALAIGCANKNLILENSVYYVASPEACAAILWKDRAAAGKVSGSCGGGRCAAILWMGRAGVGKERACSLWRRVACAREIGLRIWPSLYAAKRTM